MRLTRHLTPGLALGIAAVVIASAGSATAASLITGAQIKDGTVTGRDIRDRSIGPRDIRRQAVAAQLAPELAPILAGTDATLRAATSHEIGPGEAFAAIDVLCPEGRVAVGGGGGFVRKPHIGQLGSSIPLTDDTGALRGWTVTGRTEAIEGDLLEVYAICVR